MRIVEMLGEEFNRRFLSSPLIVIGTLAIIALVLFINVLMLLRNRFPTRLYKIEGVIYVVTIIAMVIIKSSYTSAAVNFNPFDLFTQAIEQPAVLLFNILAFIPIGCVMFSFCKHRTLSLSIALIFIVLIEAAQYIFSIGVCDIVDVLTNFFGYAFGYLGCEYLSKRYSVEKISRRWSSLLKIG